MSEHHGTVLQVKTKRVDRRVECIVDKCAHLHQEIEVVESTLPIATERNMARSPQSKGRHDVRPADALLAIEMAPGLEKEPIGSDVADDRERSFRRAESVLR